MPVIPSTEARTNLPRIIGDLVEHPEQIVEIGRQRRREVVVLSAERYDAIVKREEAVRDLAWVAFAQERIEHPTGEPVSWEEARQRRQRG